MTLRKPVVLIIFNRPELTLKVFSAISQAKPETLLIIADGPRHKEEEKKCQDSRFITENIDWNCRVLRNYSDVNLGCKRRVLTGLDWVFDQVEEAIILEDDCLPNPAFFRYCSSLLDHYRDDKRIMLISGFNRQETWKNDVHDYFFSNLGGIWGWATWREAWKLNDPEMVDLEAFSRLKYFEYLLGPKLGKLRKGQMFDIKANEVDTWDFSWGFSRHKNSGLACVPSQNLIKNIGFGRDATHTTNDEFHDIKTYPMTFPLKKNMFVVADQDYDKIFFRPNISRKKFSAFQKLFLRLLRRFIQQ